MVTRLAGLAASPLVAAPIHPKLARALKRWLEERRDWPGQENPALFLNQRGGNLSVKAAHDMITGIANRTERGSTTRSLPTSAPHLRHHTGAWWHDLVIVAELLGHARLETTREYTRPTAADRAKALDLLTVEE